LEELFSFGGSFSSRRGKERFSPPPGRHLPNRAVLVSLFFPPILPRNPFRNCFFFFSPPALWERDGHPKKNPHPSGSQILFLIPKSGVSVCFPPPPVGTPSPLVRCSPIPTRRCVPKALGRLYFSGPPPVNPLRQTLCGSLQPPGTCFRNSSPHFLQLLFPPN